MLVKRKFSTKKELETSAASLKEEESHVCVWEENEINLFMT